VTVKIKDLAPDLCFSDITRVALFEDLKLGDKFAEGGYSTLHKGTLNGKTVAVKVITDVGMDTPFQDLQHEVFVMSKLSHPNLVELKGICLSPLCMILDYFPLGSLNTHVQESSPILTWNYRVNIALDIIKGMIYLHSKDIIHRDLRSHNILVITLSEVADVTVKVGDFGTAVALAGCTIGGEFNYRWTAPEILSGTTYSEKIDLYSFGIVLWELLQAGFPFAEYKDLDQSCKADQAKEIIAGLRPTIPKDCPPLYHEIILKCWANDPTTRPSFKELEPLFLQVKEKLNPEPEHEIDNPEPEHEIDKPQS